MSQVLLFNKPYGVLTQFTSEGGHATLADYIRVTGVYPAGRLDLDSEGLVVLTDDGALQGRISHPRHKLPKTYWAQVEGVPDEAALAAMRRGLDLGDFRSGPCAARIIPEPAGLWPRVPPIRFRKAIPTTWLEIVIAEGKNRQVRRMTAKIGYPTLRLIRWAVGDWTLANLAPGEWRPMTKAEMRHKSGAVS
ncbi:MAG: pseudouridine synthase [Ignavibacteria bacterium]